MDRSLTHRRALRAGCTDAEVALWFHLRDRRTSGFKFRRQHPIGPFIVDFYCPERHLAIALDGGQHFEPAAQAYDERRTAFLQNQGIAVLRFSNDLIFQELQAVLEMIFRAVREDPSP
jgi:very-short-patch-repair endonuclease